MLVTINTILNRLVFTDTRGRYGYESLIHVIRAGANEFFASHGGNVCGSIRRGRTEVECPKSPEEYVQRFYSHLPVEEQASKLASTKKQLAIANELISILEWVKVDNG